MFYAFCRTTAQPKNATYWEKEPTLEGRVCSVDDSGNNICPEGTFCGSPFDNKMEMEEAKRNANIQFGIHTFDNFLSSIMTVFQMITKDSWTVVLYNLKDATNPFLATLFCATLITLGSFFLLNVVLAVIMEKFTKV